MLQVQSVNSTAYHPSGNGMVERTIKSIKQILTMYINFEHSNWDNYLQSAVSAYNTSIHSSTKYSPYEALFLRKPVLQADIVLGVKSNVVDSYSNVGDYVNAKRETSDRINSEIQSNLKKAQEKQKFYYDRFTKNKIQFKTDDLVLVTNEHIKPGQSKSFAPKLVGPFQIVQVLNDVNFVIRNCSNGKSQKIHYNRLRPYVARSTHSLEIPKISPILEKRPARKTAKPLPDFFVNLRLLFLNQMIEGETRPLNEVDVEIPTDEETVQEETQPDAEEETQLDVATSAGKVCVVCQRVFKNGAGLASHKRAKHKTITTSDEGEGL
jgi:hypothetical protein